MTIMKITKNKKERGQNKRVKAPNILKAYLEIASQLRLKCLSWENPSQRFSFDLQNAFFHIRA